MNPILLHAINALLAKQKAVAKSGEEVTDGDREEYIRAQTKGQFGWGDAQKVIAGIDTHLGLRNLGRSAAQGALFNWGDEALGMLPEALGGGEAAKEKMRLSANLFHEAHPAADVAAGVGGALVPMLIPGVGEAMAGGKIAEGASLARTLAKGAGIGAAYGGIAGAGSGTDAHSRAVGGAEGAAGGAVLGAAMPAVLKTAPAIREMANSLTPISAAAAKVARAVRLSGGVEAVRASNAAARAAGKGDVVVAGDLSPHLQRLTDYAANHNPETWINARETFNARQAGMTDRMLGDARTVIGEPNAAERQTALESSRKSWANGPNGYGGLRSGEHPFDEATFLSAIDKPLVSDGWGMARRADDINGGSNYDEMFKRIAGTTDDAVEQTPANAEAQHVLDRMLKGEKVSPAEMREVGIYADGEGLHLPDEAVEPVAEPRRPISFNDAQQFVRHLDSKTGMAYAKGNKPLGDAYAAVRNNVRSALSKASPDYEAVQAGYASRKDLEAQLAKGVEDWSANDTMGFEKLKASMSPEQLDQYRTGMASKMISNLRSANTNIDTAKRITQASPNMKAKLRMIFGSDDAFAHFVDQANWETKMAQTKGAVGGSRTTLGLAENNFDPIDVVAKLHHGIIAPSRALMNSGLSTLTKNYSGVKAGAVGDAVLTQGSDAIADLLNKMSQRGPLMGAKQSRMQSALPAAAAYGQQSLFGDH